MKTFFCSFSLSVVGVVLLSIVQPINAQSSTRLSAAEIFEGVFRLHDSRQVVHTMKNVPTAGIADAVVISCGTKEYTVTSFTMEDRNGKYPAVIVSYVEQDENGIIRLTAIGDVFRDGLVDVAKSEIGKFKGNLPVAELILSRTFNPASPEFKQLISQAKIREYHEWQKKYDEILDKLSAVVAEAAMERL